MSAVSVSQAFELALQHHQAGRRAEAEALYRQILGAQPHHAGALHYLGVLAHQAGRNDLAVDLVRQAIALAPHDATAYSNLGSTYHSMGRLEEAIASFRRAIELHSEYPEALYNLGVVLVAVGRTEEAVAAYRRAVEVRPNYLEAHNNLGVALASLARLDEAASAYRRALALNPGHAETQNNLGNVLRIQGKFEEAAALYRSAITLRPDFPEAHTNLGVVLVEQGQFDEAVAAHARALELKPSYSMAFSNLSIALREKGQLHEAMAACHRALELEPDNAAAHNNLGNVLRELGQLDEAAAAYRRSLEGNPDLGEAQFNYAFLLLLRGEFERGWPLYEGRRADPRRMHRNYLQPRWDGRTLHGERVLVHAEQGFGDAIQFVRYASLIAERGGVVIVECQAPLAELIRTATGVHEVVATGDPSPPFDFQIPMLSLPLIFRTNFESIPREVPYLFPDAARCEEWRQRIGQPNSLVKVGLTWTGNALTHVLRKRHIDLSELLPLLNVEGAAFYSLQVGAGSEQIGQMDGAASMAEYTRDIKDFADTAAFMNQLDLVISVDTAAAHLAGALGRPVWTFLPFVPDWRWGLETEETPWYPTMRLFRQPAMGDWAPVIRRVAQELDQWICQKRSAGATGVA